MVAFVVPRNPAKGRSPATGPDLVHWLWWPGNYRRVSRKLQWRWPLVICTSRGPAGLTTISTPRLLRYMQAAGEDTGSRLSIAHSRTALERLSPFLFIRWTRVSSSSHEGEPPTPPAASRARACDPTRASRARRRVLHRINHHLTTLNPSRVTPLRGRCSSRAPSQQCADRWSDHRSDRVDWRHRQDESAWVDRG